MMTVACQTQDCISQTGVMGADPQLTYPTATGWLREPRTCDGRNGTSICELNITFSYLSLRNIY